MNEWMILKLMEGLIYSLLQPLPAPILIIPF